MTSIFKSSFYKRIQLSSFIFILLPLALASIFSYILIKEVVVTKAENSNQSVVNIIANDLNKNIEDMIYASNLFGNPDSIVFEELRKFKDVRELSSFEDYQRYELISDFLHLTYSKTSGLGTQVIYVNKENLAVYGSNNIFMDESLASIADKQWLDTLKPNKLYWTDEINLKSVYSSIEETYYFAVRVFNESSSKDWIGAVFIGIPSEYFENLFAGSENGEFLLYDEDEALIFNYVADEQVSIEDHNFEVSAHVSNSNWRVIYRTSIDQVTAEISHMFKFYAIVVSICILIFLILSIFISRSLYRPLNELKHTAEQFGHENFNVRFPVSGNDEIAVLGTAFNHMLDQIKQLFTRDKQNQEEKRIIELEALFAQIQPHFLINTLNSIKYNLILKGDDEHSGKINSLMRLLRAYMNMEELTFLNEECQLLNDYNEIMQMRNDRSVKMVIDLSEETENFRVPRLILQPIVENAIVHGFAEDLQKPAIYIHGEIIGREVTINIKDNGIGMSAIEIEEVNKSLADKSKQYELGKHVGLRNILQRLRLTYGKEALLSIYANEQSGITVRIKIPKIE